MMNQTTNAQSKTKGEIKAMILKKLQHKPNKLFKKKQLYYALNLDKDNLWDLYDEAIVSLLKMKLITSNKNKKLKLKIDADIMIGVIHFSPKGFGFANELDNNGDNYFISKENTSGAIHEDIVAFIEIKENESSGKRKEAKVLFVIHRSLSEIVGTFQSGNGFGFVIPDDSKINTDIYIPEYYCKKVIDYEKVLVKIHKHIEGRKPIGEIIEILGVKGSKEAEELSVIKANNLKDAFPAAVKKEASYINTSLTSDDLVGRVDYRNETVFTIDGADAKDLDDAISISKEGDLYHLGVYIADVSHYVKEYSEIDKEALERGTSVYLVDKVIPMLPKILSNNVCSLNRGSDKLVLSCHMWINSAGQVVKSQITEGVINSKGRLTYEEVNAFLTGFNDKFKMQYPKIHNDLLLGVELANLLKDKREKNGSIEFDRPETKIEVDEDGHALIIKPYPRGASNDMIEEFMLITNQTIAKTFSEKEIPFVYRVHGYPRKEKVETFMDVASKVGIDLSAKNLDLVSPKELNAWIDTLKGGSYYQSLSFMLLKSMQQAKYSSVKTLHFGLAFDDYCHFTSPIRRYPDLQIHRIIKDYIHSNLNQMKLEHYQNVVESVSKKASILERNAERAEKDLKTTKIVEYMENHPQEVFAGHICNFNTAGLFVQLENSVDGFVRLSNFDFDSKSYTGEFNGKTYHLGDPVNVRPCKQNLNTKELIFSLVE